jgi:hypothetical protein
MDIREMILSQLKVILGTLPMITTVVRNRGLLDQEQRPAAVLMDGDETARLTGDKRGRIRMSPELITMKPQLFIVLKSQKPNNEYVGEDINNYRAELIVGGQQSTQTSLTLVGSNGNIAYTGCVTDLKSGQFGRGPDADWTSISPTSSIPAHFNKETDCNG